MGSFLDYNSKQLLPFAISFMFMTIKACAEACKEISLLLHNNSPVPFSAMKIDFYD